MKLGDLNVGERGRVTGFEPGDTAHRQKLLSMGLTPGAEFSFMRVAPLGDPVEVRVRGASLSLRRDEASALLIERVAAEEQPNRKATTTIAIVGNPNCGKTTLFNGLTGTHQRVDNWGGVTVEKKVGEFEFADQRFCVVDMPGIDSLDAYDEATSVDERIARDYVLSGEADLIINIIDASHLEHSLYLTTQLLEMSAPVAVVLNIMDDADDREAELDVDAVRRRLGCPVAAIVGTRRKEIESLKAHIQQWVQEREFSDFSIDYPPLIETAISELSLLIRETSTTNRLDDRWLALRLLEGDGFATRLATPATKDAYLRLAGRILRESGDEADTIIANSRYQFAHMVADETLPERFAAAGSRASERLDRIVLNRFLGIPIFLAVMYCLFWFTIELSRAFRPFFWLLSETLFIDGPRYLLGAIDTPAWLTALIADGLGNGLLQVVTFIPIIGFLYLFVSMLEESGYMTRANFVMDRVMKSLGLPGNAFIPMVVGFGCNVPAIMATRAPPKEEQGFGLLERLSRAVMTVPRNLKAMVGMGKPVRLHKAAAGLAPALATKFDGQVGALAYLILILCYPCIATTAATVRETNRRWTGFMVFWTISIGYGAAVLFYQTGTFVLHPYASAAWIVGLVTYFVALGSISFYVGARPRTIAARDVGAKA
ncbi:MAG: ferrous iron transport protein B [Methylocystis silviterrae]|uniref:ferrous iron transport protein B n=1 Tax=Methylocystis silviterrae TaxID=2743612 RepID=UPI003C73921F